jgi:hypothetical protein
MSIVLPLLAACLIIIMSVRHHPLRCRRTPFIGCLAFTCCWGRMLQLTAVTVCCVSCTDKYSTVLLGMQLALYRCVSSRIRIWPVRVLIAARHILRCPSLVAAVHAAYDMCATWATAPSLGLAACCLRSGPAVAAVVCSAGGSLGGLCPGRCWCSHSLSHIVSHLVVYRNSIVWTLIIFES